MLQQIVTLSETGSEIDGSFPLAAPSRVFALTEDHIAETQAFLSIRPVQTVVMSSFISDNGIVSELNRGQFFGHRDTAGKLDGVALIGHTTLVEARSDEALKALAVSARQPETPIHLIMSSGNEAERFHSYLTDGSAIPRLTCTEVLFEAKLPFAVQSCKFDVRKADMSQLQQIAAAQAEIAFVESGVDPLTKDCDGFLKRVARRIEQGRVFSVYEDGKLIFKADIIAQTAETIYLEGIFVHPDHRGTGIGSSCLSALTLNLFSQADNICLLSNIEYAFAHRAYEKAGYFKTDQSVSLFV